MATSGLNALAGATGLGVLAHERVGQFRTVRGDAELRRSRIDGSHEIVFPRRRQFMRLTGLQDAALVGVMNAGRESVVVLRGREVDCPVSYRIVAVGRNDAGNTRVGNCRSDFMFTGQRGSVLATEIGAADPELWHYEKREVFGPILKSALRDPVPERPSTTAARSLNRTHTASTSRRQATSSRRATSPRQATASSHRTVAVVAPPKKLQSVGYEVVPESVEVSERDSTPTVKLD